MQKSERKFVLTGRGQEIFVITDESYSVYKVYKWYESVQLMTYIQYKLYILWYDTWDASILKCLRWKG